MKSILSAFIVLFTLVSCQKELSSENGFLPPVINDDAGTSSGTALLRLQGAPNGCSNYAVGGIYYAAVPLTQENSVSINVYVDSIGTYNISTATINGISFSGSGTFTSTGLQMILLTGAGIPLGSGTFNYKPGTNWCAFPVVVQNAPGPPVAAGTVECGQAWSEGVFQHGLAMDSTNKIFIPVNVSTAGSYAINTAPMNGTTFSGSGNLQAGAQTIVLTGNGMPVNAGAFLMEVNLGANNCSLYITFQ